MYTCEYLIIHIDLQDTVHKYCTGPITFQSKRLRNYSINYFDLKIFNNKSFV